MRTWGMKQVIWSIGKCLRSIATAIWNSFYYPSHVHTHSELPFNISTLNPQQMRYTMNNAVQICSAITHIHISKSTEKKKYVEVYDKCFGSGVHCYSLLLTNTTSKSVLNVFHYAYFCFSICSWYFMCFINVIFCHFLTNEGSRKKSCNH